MRSDCILELIADTTGNMGSQVLKVGIMARIGYPDPNQNSGMGLVGFVFEFHGYFGVGFKIPKFSGFLGITLGYPLGLGTQKSGTKG